MGKPKKRKASIAASKQPKSSSRPAKPDPIAILNRRELESGVGRLLYKRFGPFVKAHPEAWRDRAFLLLIGKVYVHLLKIELVAPKEFVELTKTLVEQFKVSPKNSQGGAGNRCAEELDGVPVHNDADQLAETLDRVVREIYGVHEQKTEVAASQSAAPACASIDSSAGT